MQILWILISVFMLVAWAVLQVLSKESPPTPMRSQPGGGRPGGLPPAPRLQDRGAAQRPAPQRAGTSGRGADPNDEIIILSAETLRNPAPVTPRSAAAARARAPKRARPAQPASPPRPEPARKKTLGGPVTQKLTQTLEKAEPLLPLTIGTSPLLVAAASTAEAERAAEPTQPRGFEFGPLLDSPSRIRDAFVLSEILQPPVSMRPRRR